MAGLSALKRQHLVLDAMAPAAVGVRRRDVAGHGGADVGVVLRPVHNVLFLFSRDADHGVHIGIQFQRRSQTVRGNSIEKYTSKKRKIQ